MDIQSVIDQLKALHPQAIILFGSAARGNLHPDSDIDLLLIQRTNKPFFQRMLEARLAVRSSAPLDILVITPKESKTMPQQNEFFREIIEEGKLVYGRI